MIRLFREVRQLWWRLKTWAHTKASKLQLLVVACKFVAVWKLFWGVINAVWLALGSPTQHSCSRMFLVMRQNLFASAIVLSGVAIIVVVLTLPEPEEPVLVDPPQASRPTYAIGALLSLTGLHERRGNEMRRGYEIALKAYNDNGGIRLEGIPHNLTLVIYDDESSPVRAAEVAQLLFSLDKPEILLSPYSSALAKPVIHLAQQNSVPVVVPIASAAGLPETAGVFLLQTPPSRHLTQAATLFADHAEDLVRGQQDKTKKAKKSPFINGQTPRVAVAWTKDPHSASVMKQVLATLQGLGITDIVAIDVTAPDKEFSEATQVLGKTDALFIAAYAQGALRIMESIATAGYTIPYVALTHCVVAQISRQEPLVAEGALCSLHWQQEANFTGSAPLENGFATDFHKAYGSNPPHHAAASAAAIQVIASALKYRETRRLVAALQQADANQDENDTEPPTTTDELEAKMALTKALARTNLHTFYGPIKFNAAGVNSVKPMVLSQIVQSRYIPVAPANIAKQKLNFKRPRLVRAKKK